jgi:diguanylate cyclase (GGDEF)-like protein
LAGDDCLNHAARCIEQLANPREGTVARFGGEEFVVLLPGMGAQDALQLADAIRLCICQTPVESGGRQIRLSASIGMHAIDETQQSTAEDVIRSADDALYRAKDEGRNCVRQSGDVA